MFGDFIQAVSIWSVPMIITSIIVLGLIKKIKVYECFVEGAAEGIHTVVKIIPFLVAMMVSIQVFRSSGALGEFLSFGAPLFRVLGIPSELIPLAMMRPLSGTGTMGLGVDLMNFYGVDSLYGKIAATIMASSDTTFYILAVYFGSVGISKVGYSIFTGLFADLVAFFTAVYLGSLLFT